MSASTTQWMLCSYDAVEAYSCVDDFTDKRFLSKTLLIDKLTAGRSNQLKALQSSQPIIEI